MFLSFQIESLLNIPMPYQIHTEILRYADTITSHIPPNTDSAFERADDAIYERCHLATRINEPIHESTGSAKDSDGVRKGK